MKTTGLRLFCAVVFAATALLSVAPASAVGTVNIMPLGDSITAGYTDNPTWSVPFGFGYRSGLYTRLNNASYPYQYVGGSLEPWNGVFGVPQTVTSPDLRTVNQDKHRGYGGQGAGYLSTGISSWLNTDSPDVVLLMIGINDIGNVAAAEASLNTLVQSIVVQRPKAHLIVAQITPTVTTNLSSFIDYNNYIKNTLVPTYAGWGKNITTVDQYSNFVTNGVVNSNLYSNGFNHPNATGYDKMAQTWYNGIQALGTVDHDAGPAKAVLANGSFEAPQYTTTTHSINPSGGSWTFTASGPNSAGAGSGIDYGNPYGAAYTTNCTPSIGAQMGFLQGIASDGVSRISQTMSGLIVGKTYSVKFLAKGINGFSGTNPFRVSAGITVLNFNGTTLLTPGTTTGYTNYSSTFVASSTSMQLKFYDQGNSPVGKVTWIDNVKLGIVTPTASNLVSNGTFEAGTFTSNSHNINPSGTGWRFTTGAAGAGTGIDLGNPYGASCTNASSFDGLKHAFLQGAGTENGVSSIEQDVPGFQIGSRYRLTFESAAIQGFSGANPFFVSMDGNEITFGDSDYISPSVSYGLYVSTPFYATDTTMTLRFYDAGHIPVTYLSWIDDVQITSAPVYGYSAVPEPATGVFLGSLALVSLIACYARRASRKKA